MPVKMLFDDVPFVQTAYTPKADRYAYPDDMAVLLSKEEKTMDGKIFYWITYHEKHEI